MKYIYFISYEQQNGIGNTDVTLSESIKGINDIRAIEAGIAKKNGFNNVVITNYIQF